MIKTLHAYLARDLAKTTCLALVAFTLVMTIFAIMEPLRKEGLNAEKALSLIVYTLPMMMSLTLPVAALFAATIVYGRFSQDRELMACRASGIATLSLLKPALALGGLVTIASLALNGYVTPKMVRMVELAVKADLRGIFYRQLRTRPYFDFKDIIVHADAVDEGNDEIIGLVAAEVRKGKDINLVVAPRALVKFDREGGQTQATIFLIQAALAREETQTVGALTYAFSRPLPGFVEEEPAWCDWPRLVKTLRDPTRNSRVKEEFQKIKTLLCFDMLAQDIVAAVREDRPYAGLRDAEGRYEIRAGSARVAGKGEVRLESAKLGDALQPVDVVVHRDGAPSLLVTAGSGRILAGRSDYSERDFVTIELTDGVTVRDLTAAGQPPQHQQTWKRGELPLPPALMARAQAVDLIELASRPQEFTSDGELLRKIHNLRGDTIERLINKIKAEMHMRVAYGVSCFLMVAMGAALGLLFRGGQIISAFAITAAPAALVIVMMLMGKQMVNNRDVSVALGLSAIWAGVLALLAADVVIYLFLRRR